MKREIQNTVISLVAMITFGIGTTAVAETLKGLGGGHVVAASSITMGNGDTIVLAHTKQVLHVETSDGTVYHPGECTGTSITKADGSYGGAEGYCTYTENADDTWDVIWKEVVVEGGTFSIIGGKGKWKDIKASGGKYTYTWGDDSQEQFRYTFSIDYTM